MSLFRRKPKVPEWASFMAPDEYARFMGLVTRALDERGTTYTLGDGELITAEGTFGLVNLAQMCHQDDDPAALVTAHLERTFASLGSMPETWVQAAPLLRARLGHPAMTIAGGLQMIHRPVATDLVLLVACDLPTTIGFVTREQVEDWGQPEEEVFERALRQTRELEEPPEVEELASGDGTALVAVHGESMFVSAHALWLDEDSVVAVPHRHAVLYHPIRDMRVVDAIGYLADMARGMSEEGPGSISDQLYWKRGDELIHLPVEHAADRPQLYPPDEFVELLNALAERE